MTITNLLMACDNYILSDDSPKTINVKKFDIVALMEYIRILELQAEDINDDLFEATRELETLRLANKLIYDTRTKDLEAYNEL